MPIHTKAIRKAKKASKTVARAHDRVIRKTISKGKSLAKKATNTKPVIRRASKIAKAKPVRGILKATRDAENSVARRASKVGRGIGSKVKNLARDATRTGGIGKSVKNLARGADTIFGTRGLRKTKAALKPKTKRKRKMAR